MCNTFGCAKNKMIYFVQGYQGSYSNKSVCYSIRKYSIQFASSKPLQRMHNTKNNETTALCGVLNQMSRCLVSGSGTRTHGQTPVGKAAYVFARYIFKMRFEIRFAVGCLTFFVG